jgi:hypothetical protein
MSTLRRACALLSTAVATLAAAQPWPPPAEPPPSTAPAPPGRMAPPPRDEPAPSPGPGAQAAPERSAPPASAPARHTEGLTFAVRGAWLKPHGIVAGISGSDNELPLDREFASGTQLTLEAGYRFPVGLTAALFLQYGLVAPGRLAGNGMCETASCSDGRTLKYGLEVLYHFLRDRPLSPFVGAGFGWERTGYHVSDATGSADLRYQGWQWLDAQAGADWAVSPQVYLGAFIANSFGRYDELVVSGSGVSVSGDIEKKRIHDWLQVGLRLRYDL